MQYQNDYILRLIEQMGALIRRALESARTGAGEEPLELADQAIGLALDMDPAVAARMSPSTLSALLSINVPDERVLTLVSEALEIEAEALEARADLVAARLRREQAQAVRDSFDPSRAN